MNENEYFTKSAFESHISRNRAGWVIPTCSGLVSFFSSALIIYIITKSKASEFTSTYHRIVVFMSSCDMLTSLAIALTTIPMPKSVNEIYDFDGKSYGTEITCTLQGASFLFASYLSYCSNIALTLYYVLTIRYQPSVRTMKCYFEPAMLLVSIIIATFPLIEIISENMLNPVPFTTWCTLGDYPLGCNAQGLECISGDVTPLETKTTIHIFCIGILMHVVSLILIVVTVFEKERVVRNNELELNDTNNGQRDNKIKNTSDDSSVAAIDRRRLKTRFTFTRQIAKQAFVYFGAFIVSFMCVPSIAADTDNLALQAAILVLKPLQGFFNAIIFIYDKVLTLLQSDDDLTVLTALKRLLKSPEDVPVMIIEDPSGIILNYKMQSIHKLYTSDFRHNNMHDHDEVNSSAHIFKSDGPSHVEIVNIYKSADSKCNLRDDESGSKNPSDSKHDSSSKQKSSPSRSDRNSLFSMLSGSIFSYRSRLASSSEPFEEDADADISVGDTQHQTTDNANTDLRNSTLSRESFVDDTDISFCDTKQQTTGNSNNELRKTLSTSDCLSTGISSL